MVQDIRNFQEGGKADAIAAQLKRQDVADLLRTHKPALDELFNAYALMQDELLSSELVPTGDAADAEIRAAFAAFDRDSSGGIDALELTGALAKLGLQASTDQAQKVLARYDSDASRQLELAEFRALVADLRTFQGGGGGGSGGGGAAGGTPRLLTVDELLSMMHGFRLVPSQINEGDVRAAVKEMQPSSSASVALQPMRRELFDEALLRLAHFAASRNPSLRTAEPGKRLDELLRSMLVYDVRRMRALVSEHRLREACSVGDVDTASTLIRERVAVDAKDHEGWTALHRACAYGFDDCVQELVAARASLPQRGPKGFTAVHFASEYGHLPIVMLLLKARAAPADRSDDGWTPLHRAALDGHAPVVSALLNAHKDARTGGSLYPLSERDKQGDSALHDASRNGHLAVVKELVAAKAQLDAPNQLGETPLDAASKAGRSDVVDFLSIKMRGKGGGGGGAIRR